MAQAGAQSYLIGKINKYGLSSGPYANWFEKGYQDYRPDTTLIAKIDEALKPYEIKLFMGTWCGDSRREVPRFYKILEQANYPMEQLTAVALGRSADLYKKSPNHEEKGLTIHRVPTFIFYKDGKEVNRIVERPVASLEQDIAAILDDNYTSKYHTISILDALVNKDDFYQLALKQLPQLKRLTGSMFELNTYAKYLISNNLEAKALEVYRLNTVLFNNQTRTFLNYAKALEDQGLREKAIVTLDEGLKHHPTNLQLRENRERYKSN